MEIKPIEVKDSSEDEVTSPALKAGFLTLPEPPRQYTNQYVWGLQKRVRDKEREASNANEALKDKETQLKEMRDDIRIMYREFQEWYNEMLGKHYRSKRKLNGLKEQIKKLEKDGDIDLDVVNLVIKKVKKYLGGVEVPSEMIEGLIKAIQRNRQSRATLIKIEGII